MNKEIRKTKIKIRQSVKRPERQNERNVTQRIINCFRKWEEKYYFYSQYFRKSIYFEIKRLVQTS